MNQLLKFGVRRVVLLCLACAPPSGAAGLPPAWQHEQAFTVPAPGLVKLSLPVETLDAARPGLEDLRLYDEAGNEVPYWIAHSAPVIRRRLPAKSFHVSLLPHDSVITLETGLTQAVDGLTLESPAHGFIKPVRIEGSLDRENWRTLAEGQPVFRQPDGAAQLQLSFPSGVWTWLRLTVDDHRSQPIPLTGASVDVTAVAAEPEATEWTQAAIVDRHENPDESRLTLNLGAANLDIDTIKIETEAPLFARQITLAVTQVSEDSIREQTLARGTIFRIAIEGAPASETLLVPLHSQVRSRQLLLFINNGDSPPLPVREVRVARRPVDLLFLARQAGSYYVLTGNSLCSAPCYDLSALHIDPKSVPGSALTLPPLVENPGYQTPEVLPGITDQGAPLDISAWKFRKPVKIVRAGAQQLELDLDALAHAQSGLQDIRLLRGTRQIPFIIEHTSITCSIEASATAANVAKESGLSRWTIELPKAGLPLTQLACTVQTPLFQREMALYQEMEDERGTKYRQLIGQGSWMQTPDRTNRDFVLQIDSLLHGDRVFLETRNGDNPPIQLQNFRLFYSAPRILFKASTDEPVFLYYGNANAAAPQYDLSLVGDQLVMADKASAALSAEERLQGSADHDKRQSGMDALALWSVLALAVVVLLWLIRLLLSKPLPPS
ncbi:MAG: DUF3999 family protein [Verrucomicrobiota bacterium]